MFSNCERSIVASSGLTTPALVDSEAPTPFSRKYESRMKSSAPAGNVALRPAPLKSVTIASLARSVRRGYDGDVMRTVGEWLADRANA